MTRMIFVRHGQSSGNLEKRFYGHYDGALTKMGIEQAKKTAEYLKDTHIDVAYASDLVRAFETGRIIAEPHGLVPTPDRELRELYAGEWENIPFEELPKRYPESIRVWVTDIGNSRPDGGESVRELSERIRRAVWRIAEENEGKNVLIATHATPIRMLACEWFGKTVEEAQGVEWVKNASVCIVDYDIAAHTTMVELYDEASFMGDMITTLPNSL